MLESKEKKVEDLDEQILIYKDCKDEKKKRMLHINIVENGMHLVKKIAGNISAQSGISNEDLVQVGSIGLIKAIEFFNPDKNTRFSQKYDVLCKTFLTCLKGGSTMSYQLQESNRRIDQDGKGFLEACDAQYANKVSQAADTILNNLSTSPIVLLSGPSGSGMTSTALMSVEELVKRGVLSHSISMDNYFKPLNPKTVPRTKDGSIDFESPLCMDMDLLNDHFAKLSRGETNIVPRFEFARQMRNDSMGTPLKLEKNEIVIFEVIHALNDDIAGRHPEAAKLYISARSNVNEGAALRFKGTWMRLTRRAVRDYNFRGTGVAETLDMWANVRRGEKLYISPFKQRANYIFDSSLPYEVSVMKNYAMPLLEAVPQENVRRKELLELIDGFQGFHPIDPELVPPASLIREFIGGGIYDYS